MELRVKKSALMLTMGALVLALAGVGCGDDDAPGGTGGSGGSGGSGGTGGGGEETCEEQTLSNTNNMVSNACATCLCDEDEDATVACDETCWGLVQCNIAMCPVPVGDPPDVACVSSMCTPYLSALTVAGDFAPVITSCRTECLPSSNPDAGNDDGGNTDGGN